MVDQVELFEVADAIVGEGKIPSLRLVRERLSKRGSFSDVGPLFLHWCAERNFRSRPTAKDLPERLAGRLATVAAEIWRDGHREGNVVAQNEQARLVAERDSLKTALVEALTMVDGLEKRVQLLREEMLVHIKPSRERSDKIAFWKGLMEEIAALLGGRSLTAAQIIAEMNEETVRKAKEAEADWCPANLADRMRGRVRNGKYFEEPVQGTFRRLRSTAS